MFESLKNLLKHFTGCQETTSASAAAPDKSAPGTGSPPTQPATEGFSEKYITLAKFNLGLGSIGPDNRNDVDPKTVNEMYQAIAAGLFNIPVTGKVPEICVDGRTNKDGSRLSAPCAAGGTLSIVYGGDLGGSSAAPGIDEIQLTAQTISALKGKGHSTGVHGDDHSSCGCGACAKAPTIYQHITERINEMASLVSQLGINLTDSEKESIVQQAKNRLSQTGFFAEDRAAVVQTAQDNGASYEELVGKHNELGIALNTKPGTTVDRTAIRAKYGPQYDVFVVDAWAFGNAAKDINANGSEADEQRIAKAITLQNVATASVLGHGSLRIVPIA
ncbi:MAG: cadmium-containing carbonic anhydrase [Nitrosomonas sp.]|nr:MAG: cadmium-containing carbonic anhydrase [Nitrosomonas sp.]